MSYGETSGLAGTLFGIAACGVLLVGALGTIQTPSCSIGKPQNVLRVLAKHDVLRQRHELLGQAINTRDKDFAEVNAAISEAQQLLIERQAKLPKVKAEVILAEQDYNTTKQALEEYQRRYQETSRLKAPGEPLGNLKVRSGTVYQDAYIQCVTDGGLEIRHRTGKARIAPEDLPEELQKRFQWDPDKTAEVRAREQQAAEAFQVAVAKKRQVSSRDA